jgi:hypothetical protein
MYPDSKFATRFMTPGLPFSRVPRDKLFIILTRSARVIGPALRVGEPINLVYTSSPALFRYLGTMRYLIAGAHKKPAIAHM